MEKMKPRLKESLILWAVVVFYAVFNEHHGIMEYVAFTALAVSTFVLGAEILRSISRTRNKAN